MNRFSDEMKVIPRGAWALALVLPIIFIGGFVLYLIAAARSTDDGGFPLPFLVILFFITVVFFVYVLLLGYIAGDARRRGMRAALWVLLAIFTPSAIGIILYFILRDPLLHPCPRCGTGANPSFPYCPSCGASLANVCPSCKNAVEPGWSHCARCGAQLVVA